MRECATVWTFELGLPDMDLEVWWLKFGEGSRESSNYRRWLPTYMLVYGGLGWWIITLVTPTLDSTFT